MESILYGLFVGFSIGVTVGPIAVFCLHRSALEGFWAGIITGLGASAAQLVFASIAVFGFHFVQPLFDSYEDAIRIAGSMLILLIAVYLWRKPVVIDGPEYKPQDNGSAFATAFIITLSGPISIASYAAYLAFFDLELSLIQAALFLVGVFLGNLGWWIPLSYASSFFSSLFDKRYLRYSNKIAAILLSLLSLLGVSYSLYNLLV